MGFAFQVGNRVNKVTGDYRFTGYVVAAFSKRNNRQVRYVVENDDGVLFIFNAAQLELLAED